MISFLTIWSSPTYNSTLICIQVTLDKCVLNKYIVDDFRIPLWRSGLHSPYAGCSPTPAPCLSSWRCNCPAPWSQSWTSLYLTERKGEKKVKFYLKDLSFSPPRRKQLKFIMFVVYTMVTSAFTVKQRICRACANKPPFKFEVLLKLKAIWFLTLKLCLNGGHTRNTQWVHLHST